MKLEDLLTRVDAGIETTINLAASLDPDGKPAGKRLTVESRHLLPEAPRPPRRAESPPKRHTFYSADSFATYLSKYGTPQTVVFADPGRERIDAVLDERAREGFEVVSMVPQIHPLWAPWAALAGKRTPLTTFAQFIAENRRSISKPDGRTLALLLSQVRASVTVEIERGRGKNAVNGLMVRTKIQGVDKSESVELPDEIEVNAPLYVDTAAQAIPLDICLDADTGGTVTVLVCAGTVAQAKVKAFQEMVEAIEAGLDSCAATIAFGSPAHAAWSYLPEIQAK